MRILYYSPHPDLNYHAATGYGRHMREMVAAFERQGHQVHLLIGGGKEPKPATVPIHTQRKFTKRLLHPLAWQTARDLALLRFDRRMSLKLVEEINAFHPDIIYERVAYLQGSGIRIAKRMNVFHFAEVNAPFPEERQAFSGKSLLIRLSRKVEKELLYSSQAISAVSQALAQYLIRIAPQAAGKVRVIPNAVNPTDAPLKPKGDEIRKRLGLENKTIVGFVGSIFPYHGVDLLVQALSRMRERSDVYGLIVGDGATLPQLIEMAEKLGMANRIKFTGPVAHSDVYHYISAMDICCMTKSNWYGSPVKIFEYGLMGKLILAPRVAPVTEVMTDKDAEFCDPNVEDVYAALLNIISNPEISQEKAKHWHQRVLNEFSWDRAAQNVIEACT